MNYSYNKKPGIYGYNSYQKKNTPSKTGQKTGFTPTNLNQTHNTSITTKGLYFPIDANLDLSSAKVSLGRLTPNGQRTKSANRTREPSYSGIMYKAKKSVENIYNDPNISTLIDLDLIGNTRSIKHFDKPKNRETLNARTWNESRISAMRPSENVSNPGSIHMRPGSPRARDTENSIDGTDKRDASNNSKAKNVVLYFGNPAFPLQERIYRQNSNSNSNSYKPTAVTSRKASPYGHKAAESPLYLGKSFKNNGRDSSPMFNGHHNNTLTERVSVSKVSRCQSYRLGNRANSNINISSSETKTEGSPFAKNTKKPEKEHLPHFPESYKNTEENQEDVIVDAKKERKNSIPKYPLYQRPGTLLNQLITANNAKATTPNKIISADFLKKKTTTIERLTFSTKGGFMENKLHVENYKLDKVLGQGSYAVVRLAIDKETSEKVAIKTYEKFKLNDVHKRKNVKREISILQSLDHPNIIKLYKTIDTVTQLHLVTEFIGTQSLHSYIKPKPSRRLPEAEARKIFTQVIEGLGYLHSLDIVHRDIKLENLLLDSKNNVKIIDFGFSIENPKDKTLNVFCGTPSYMAPELVTKKNYYGHLIDIWAAGILLYVILAGYFPFKEVSEKDLFRRIARGQYEFPSHMSEDARSLIKKMLRLNPLERPNAEEILQDKWITGHQSQNANLKNYLDSKIQQYKNIQGLSNKIIAVSEVRV